MTKDSCKLEWQKPKDDGGVQIDHYVVEKFDPDNGIWMTAGKVEWPFTDYQVEGLVPGHRYKFRVKAVNPEGESDPLESAGTYLAKDSFCEFRMNYFINVALLIIFFNFQPFPIHPALRRLLIGLKITPYSSGRNRTMVAAQLPVTSSRRRTNTARSGRRPSKPLRRVRRLPLEGLLKATSTSSVS